MMRRCRGRYSGWIGALVAAGMACAAGGVGGGLAGCSEEKRDPNKPLTADQGDALLREMRDKDKTLSELTPAERQYLLKTLKK